MKLLKWLKDQPFHPSRAMDDMDEMVGPRFWGVWKSFKMDETDEMDEMVEGPTISSISSIARNG